MPHARPARFGDTVPAAGLHLLEACAAWSPGSDIRRVLTAKHARFAAQGWRHTIVAPGAHGSGLVDSGGLRIPGLGGSRWVLGRRHAAELIERAAPDIVEAADPFVLAWSALDASARLGVPAVATCHIGLPTLAARWAGGEGGLATRRGRWAARQARSYLVRLYEHFDLVFAPQRTLARRLASWGVKNVMEQPLGVDTALFHAGARDLAWRQRLMRQLGIPGATRLLVYSGSFNADRHLDLLADAVRLLGPGHLLLALGDGPRPPTGLRCAVLPPEPDGARLARVLASCDVYVHAGEHEGFVPGVLEAMACGTPVVVAAPGAAGELAQDAGLRVERRRVQEWAEAISAALYGNIGHLTAAALERARERDWSWVQDQMSRRYLQLLRQHAQPHGEARATRHQSPGASGDDAAARGRPPLARRARPLAAAMEAQP